MNKNLFKTFAIAAMAVLAGACAKEQVGPGEGAMVEATFDVDVPGVEVSTKGLSDAASVNELICQVFLNDGNYTPVPDLNQTVTVTDKHAKVTFNLVKGQKYSFAFWAQAKGTGYYDTGNLRAVKMNVDAVKANEPKMDAYFAQKNFQAFSTATKDTKITLYRAVAQVNFGTINSDRKDKLGIVKSTIKLTEVPTVFDVVRGNMDDAYSVPAAIEFKENALVKEKLLAADKEYDYVATCYVFAHKNQKLTDATATFWVDIRDSKGNFTTTRTVSAPNAPYKRNMRTNILGDLLTVNQDFNIVVDPDFKGGDKTYDAVSANLEKGATVTLAENYSVDSKSKGVTLDVGVTSVLNLNGKKFSNENGLKDNKAALQVHGDLTINGDGEVYCKGGADNNAIIVEQGGHLVINGGTYNVGANTNSGKSNATIFVTGPDKYGRNGSVEINGGVFMAEAGSGSDATPATPFVLNQHDDITVNCFSVKGGTFVGFNPANVNENNGAITSFVAEGYRSVKTEYEGKEAWKVEAIPAVTTQEGLNAAIADVAEGSTATVNLGAGEFTTYDNTSLKGKNVTVSYIGAGADKTTFAVGTDNHTKGEANGDYSLDGVTKASFKNMTIKVDNDNYRGYIRVKELEFENCVFENRISYWGVGKVTFKNCTFNQTADDYNLWTYSGKDFLFDGCTFNSQGKCINAFKDGGQCEYTITIRNCHFVSTKVNKSVVELKANKSYKYTLYFEGENTCEKFRVSELTGSALYNSNAGETDSSVFMGSLQVWTAGHKVE